MLHDELPVKLTAVIEKWPLTDPFRITGHTWHDLEVLKINLERQGCLGEGEAAGVYFKGETAASMLAQVQAVRERIEGGVTQSALLEWLPAGGARNALDCALWDLASKLSGHSVWQLAAMPRSHPMLIDSVGSEYPECALSHSDLHYLTRPRPAPLWIHGFMVNISQLRRPPTPGLGRG